MPSNILRALLTTLLISLVLTGAAVVSNDFARAQTNQITFDTCDSVRYLMQRGITPYDLTLGGGEITPGQAITGAFDDDYYADTWSFNVLLPRTEGGFIQPDTLTLAFEQVTPGLALEFALFSGMRPVAEISNAENTAYLPITQSATYRFQLTRDGAHTLVIRRPDIVEQTPGEYTFSADFPGDGLIILNNLRDNSTNTLLPDPPILNDGREIIQLPAGNFHLHPGAASSVASHGGLASQARLGAPDSGFGIFVNAWANQINLLGGDLSVRGEARFLDRILYLEDYGYQIDLLDGNFANITDSNGATFRIGWQAITGVWITSDCAGFRLSDGRTFTGTLASDRREVTFHGAETDFTLQLRTNRPDGTPATHQVVMDWSVIATDSETRLYDGVFQAEIDGERTLALEAVNIELRPINDIDPPTDGVPITVNLPNHDVQIRLDWVNLRRFALTNDEIQLDSDANPRGSLTRSAEGLRRFEALNDVIHIVYAGEGEASGEQRLLLPAAENYIELITPPGMPEFDGRARPGESGFAPRGQNNLGGECYPINTLQPEANCPPNGHLNPANSNLWYAVTDHLAHGGFIDLALTRSYNSAAAAISGPFGPGWTTKFALDYDIPFDPAIGSRPIDAQTAASYPVGLNLTWAPRGIVTFTAPSGSRHTFVTGSDDFIGGTLTALTMPGWSLTRENLRDSWQLEQDTGLIYTFDRAGRLTSYGYPERGRLITVDYPRAALEGPAGIDSETPVIVTDAAELRRIELYYDANAHVNRSVLRDTSTIEDANALDTTVCELNAGCYETRYDYTDGFLTGVRYPDGSEAAYEYDSSGRLIAHNDPRAPISTTMTYSHDADGGVLAEVIGMDGVTFTWQQITNVRTDEDESTYSATLIDQYNNSRTFTYAWTTGARKSAQDTFTLLSRTSPLENVTTIETIPQEYLWVDGLLERNRSRIIDSDTGRNSVIYEYDDDSYQITRIRSGYPDFRATYNDENQPVGLTFGDGSTMTFAYDTRGWLVGMVDRGGGVHRFTRGEFNRVNTSANLSDLTAVDYEYNAVGLITQFTERRMQDDTDDVYIVDVTYDGLGRIMRVNDPITGGYAIAYDFIDDESATLERIRLIDETNTITETLFTPDGHPVEQRIYTDDHADYLRRTTYTYDALRRITGETRWLRTEDGQTPLTTRYSYSNLPVLPNQPDEISASQRVINGYQITITDAYGRTQRYAYDALDRVRQVEDAFRHVTRYDYLLTDDEANINGLRIVQRDILDGTLYATTEYVFNLRWQLRGINQNGANYEFFLDSEGVRLQAMRARQAGIIEQTWNDYQQGRPTRSDTVQVSPSLSSGTALPTLSTQIEYDFAQRPLQITDGTGTTYDVRYCPLTNGGEKTIYFPPSTSQNDDDPGCDSGTFIRAVHHDAAGRLMRVEETGGFTRDYVYNALPGQWVVTVAFDGPGGAYDWELRYDGAGDLIRWRDEYGINRHYDYDSLGRLIRVEVEDMPEASYTYQYNAADLLISELDDLGRGTLYAYDEQGHLTVQQDARTADATIYGYNVRGSLSTVISPLGSTTTYLYEDPANPYRLTGIIEPTGTAVQFTWDDEDNRLIYTGPRGNSTTYTFDGLGALWRIEDALNRTHEIHHDAAGRLSEWRMSQRANADPAMRFVIERATPYEWAITSPAPNVDWTRRFTLSPDGQLQAIAAEAGGRIDFGYDALGRLHRINTSERLWTLDHQAGQPELIYDNGFGTRYRLSLDALNRLTEMENGGETVTYTYQPGRNGDVTLLIEDDSERVVTYSPGDETSRPPAVILSAPGNRRSYLYNAEGLLAEIIAETCISALPALLDPLRPDDCIRTNADEVWRTGERFTYDTLGRPTRYVDQDQEIQTFAYDDSGNLNIYQDAGDKTFSYTYDALNRLESITSPAGTRLLLRYDDGDRVTGICRDRVDTGGSYTDCANAGGQIETYTYDALGRMTGQTFPVGGSESTINHFYESDNRGLLSGWGTGQQPSVTISRSLDGLGLPETLTTDNADYRFTFPQRTRPGQIGADGDLIYAYDLHGRLETVIIGENRLHYEYFPNGRGYRIHDDANGSTLDFSLDGRGFLSDINGDAAFEYFLSPDARLLVVQITRADGELIELQINQRGETQNIAYTRDNLFIDYVSDPTGQIQRQSIIGLSRYFQMDANGYITVIGYDNDSRPLTVRINDRQSGRLLYLLTFTYGPTGQRETETRQYSDGTQITITYAYNAANELAQRRVSTSQTQPITLNGSPLLLLFGALTWLLRNERRRKIALIVFGSGIGIALALTVTDAQTSNGTVYNYTYDTRGNLTRIAVQDTEIVCARYTYDSANRLIRAIHPGGEQTYAYDAFNRVTMIGQQRIVYLGDSDTIAAVFDADGTPVYRGQTALMPEFFHTPGSEPTWIVHDGRKHILAATDGALGDPVGMFDPLGRYLTLEPPDTTLFGQNPCHESALPAALVDLTVGQSMQSGMIWDATMNIHFADGRAYVPELGRFLQRDRLGPDAFGSVYGYPSRRTAPPVRDSDPGYTDGLYRLRATMMTLERIDQLNAAHVLNTHHPESPQMTVEPFLSVLADLEAYSAEKSRYDLDMPFWMASNYNLPPPYLDSNGALRMIRDNAPGQGGISETFPLTSLNPGDMWNPTIRPAHVRLDTLVHLLSPREHTLTFYEPHAWQPARPALNDMWSDNLVDGWTPPHAPNALWRWLPSPLERASEGASMLDVIAVMTALPNRDGASWVDAALGSALPQPPPLPDATSADWLTNWFTDNTLGINDHLRARWPELPGVDFPVYDIGPNTDWALTLP